MGNPLRPSGAFYDRCHSNNPMAKIIKISSLESPHIGLARSPWGLADATWLEKARSDYGEGSLWWTCHVLGEFPDSGQDSVIPESWLRSSSSANYVPGGTRRIAIDLAEGHGGDRSAVLVRDDNGVIDLWSSNVADFQTTASRVALQAQRYEVENSNISYDVSGVGADFANRLRQFGIISPVPYRGGNEGGPKHSNLRSYSAWRLRQRLDPQRREIHFDGGEPALASATDLNHFAPYLNMQGQLKFPVPISSRSHGSDRLQFSIPSRFLNGSLREELIGLRYELDLKGRIKLEKKEDYVERLKRSPDLADCLCQSFAFD